MTTHELRTLPTGAERMDVYLAARDTRFDAARWFAECSAGRVEIRDRFNIESGVFDQTGWYVQWFDGVNWVRLLDLEPGTRPRMFETYCYVVREEPR